MSELVFTESARADLPEEPPAQDPGPLGDTVVGQSQQQQQGAIVATKAPRATTC